MRTVSLCPCLSFPSSPEDHRLLVEPACGAALAPLYGSLLPAAVTCRPGPLAVVVCGGSGVTPQMLLQWQEVTAA